MLLGIETSCDETSAAIVETVPDNSYVILRSNSTSTSMELHAKTGGIIPEVAARNQIAYILPVIDDSLQKANISLDQVDAIAITYGPGLIGSLLVGVETAKTIALVLDKPLIPVNHLFGHLYANWIETQTHKFTPIPFPAIGLIVSGGHTDLIHIESHKKITWLGGTKDDAAGEAFDKIGRAMGFAYPAGPAIESLAKTGDPHAFKLPRPIMYDKTYDFSFSGLKTAAMRELQKEPLSEKRKRDLSRATQDAIADVLVYKTLKAAEEFGVKSIILGGGVSANQTLKDVFLQKMDSHISFFSPPNMLCTDNAAMIAAAANFYPKEEDPLTITADPELYFD